MPEIINLTVTFPDPVIASVVINLGPRGAAGTGIDTESLPTTDPGVLGDLWNEDGFLRISAGAGLTFVFDFSDTAHSQYLALV